MGKFHRLLEPGLNVLAPIIDQIKYVKSLKETAIEVPSQSAITQGKKKKAADRYIKLIIDLKTLIL